MGVGGGGVVGGLIPLVLERVSASRRHKAVCFLLKFILLLICPFKKIKGRQRYLQRDKTMILSVLLSLCFPFLFILNVTHLPVICLSPLLTSASPLPVISSP